MDMRLVSANNLNAEHPRWCIYQVLVLLVRRPHSTDKLIKCILDKSPTGMRSAHFWDTRRRRVVIVYRRFGTVCRSHLHGSRHSTSRNIPEENRSHQHRDGSLKSPIGMFYIKKKYTDIFISNHITTYLYNPPSHRLYLLIFCYIYASYIKCCR
jgi:hypothetical protein